ncbi:hypothetical protein [Rheinheimera sp. WS51]|uniref:hypothetical protein n=1 Tax=Rheinheimera sp. WS51 TaxID=3425886 RepID=UPI003D8EBFC2
MNYLSITPSNLINKLLGKKQKITIYDRFGNSFCGMLVHFCSESGALVLNGLESDDFVSFHNREDISSIVLHGNLSKFDWLTEGSIPESGASTSTSTSNDFDLDDFIYQAEQMLKVNFSLFYKIVIEQDKLVNLNDKLAIRRVLEVTLTVISHIANENLGSELLNEFSQLNLVLNSDSTIKVKRIGTSLNIFFNPENLANKNLKSELERGIERIL